MLFDTRLVNTFAMCGVMNYSLYINTITVEHQWLEHLWNHENMFETGVVLANECEPCHHVRRHNRDIFLLSTIQRRF